MLDVQLNPGIPGGKWARLRSLCGRDETMVDTNADVIPLIDTLLTETAGTTVKPGRAADLAVSDFDRVCASLYMEYFGTFVEGRVSCTGCSEPFELRFSLPGLMQNLAEPAPGISGPDEHGVFTSSDGRRFRLPTAGEQREASRLGTDAAIASLLDRCILPGEPKIAGDAIEKAMEQAGPVLNLDLAAGCPHCGAAQPVRFDIRACLLRALNSEKQFLLYEMHRIAVAYRWPYEEILGLRREDRRTFVGLIESEKTARRRNQSWTAI